MSGIFQGCWDSGGCKAVRQRTGTIHLLNPKCWSGVQDQDVQHRFIKPFYLWSFNNFHVLCRKYHPCLSPSLLPSLQGPRLLSSPARTRTYRHRHTSPSLSLPVQGICFAFKSSLREEGFIYLLIF